MPSVIRSNDVAILFGVSAMIVYDVMSTTNSSPQTTEINAQKRAPTLMKWVNLGLAQAGIFVAIMAYGSDPWWVPVAGGLCAATLLYAQYRYAMKSGLENPGASTETY